MHEYSPVSPDYICPRFRRVPDSLIEEPEVCEFCESYEDGLCTHPADPAEA